CGDQQFSGAGQRFAYVSHRREGASQRSEESDSMYLRVESSSLTGKVTEAEVQVIGSQLQVNGDRGAGHRWGESSEVRRPVESPSRTGKVAVFSVGYVGE